MAKDGIFTSMKSLKNKYAAKITESRSSTNL